MLDRTITALVVIAITAGLASLIGSGVYTRIHEIIVALTH